MGMKEWTLKGLFDKSPRVPSVDNAAEIADALGLELVLGPRRERPIELSADPDQFLEVPLHRALLAAGAGSSNESEEVIAHLAFRKDWLKRLGIDPGSAVVARAHGTSMMPTIHDGDMILIDRSRANPPLQPRGPKDQRPAKIYALHNGEGARIKRIELAAPDTLALLSDNPECPAEFHPAASVSIIGRVMWWGHTNRD